MLRVAKCLRSAARVPARDGVNHAGGELRNPLRQGSEDPREQSARQNAQGKHRGREEEENYLLQEISAFAETTEGKRAIAIGAFVDKNRLEHEQVIIERDETAKSASATSQSNP